MEHRLRQAVHKYREQHPPAVLTRWLPHRFSDDNGWHLWKNGTQNRLIHLMDNKNAYFKNVIAGDNMSSANGFRTQKWKMHQTSRVDAERLEFSHDGGKGYYITQGGGANNY